MAELVGGVCHDRAVMFHERVLNCVVAGVRLEVTGTSDVVYQQAMVAEIWQTAACQTSRQEQALPRCYGHAPGVSSDYSMRSGICMCSGPWSTAQPDEGTFLMATTAVPASCCRRLGLGSEACPIISSHRSGLR